MIAAPRSWLVAAAVAMAVAGCGDEPRRPSDTRATAVPTTAAGDGEAVAAPTIDPSVEEALRRPRIARRLRRCPVTEANHEIPPGQEDNPGAEVADYHGDGDLWTVLPPSGVLVAQPSDVRRDGSIARKFPWWRGVEGDLAITGRRVDRPGGTVQASIPPGYDPTGFQASAIIFPGEGCWQVTATAGTAEMTFVTLVVRRRQSA